MQEKGTISVSTEDLFPIIKKFLYSDHEIFLRELVANAIDATQKIQKLSSMGVFNGDLGEVKIKISIDENAKTITISDSGIGMTAEEIKKYINQVAFSGATEFVEKYKDVKDSNSIIGKFGMGFYSAFMVADSVDIISKSYQENTEAAKWTCSGTTDFEISNAEKESRGTDIILHVNEDSKEFLEKSRIQGILDKYCKFLPVEIEFDEKVINNPAPIWAKNPSDLKDEDYINFYKELYPMSEEPMFWIHLNVDYPFNLTGILYFPKVKSDITLHRDKIQLYSRQVFITDEVKDIVPEFLTLLHGVIDSHDIPLNVSRSYLQSDSNVKKINNYITKKVAEKLNDLFKNDRKSFEEKWESIGLFVKYGMISDEKFYDKATKFALLNNIDGEHSTIEDYLSKIEANQTDKDNKKVIIYSTDLGKQDTYIQSAKKRGYDVLDFSGMLDTHFVGTLERKITDISMKRVDADVIDKLVDKDIKAESVLTEKEVEKIVEIFKPVINDDKAEIKVEAMPEDEMPVTIIIPEFMRRMQEMAAVNGMGAMGGLPNMQNIIINGNHSLINRILNTENADLQNELVSQAYDLALLSQNLLDGKGLTSFIERSIKIATEK